MYLLLEYGGNLFVQVVDAKLSSFKECMHQLSEHETWSAGHGFEPAKS